MEIKEGPGEGLAPKEIFCYNIKYSLPFSERISFYVSSHPGHRRNAPAVRPMP